MNAPPDIATAPATTRHDGWTADRRRTFLELLAEGHIVEAACAQVGMSKVTAYALRRRDSGFALAWSAALLRARDTVADMLTSRAAHGQVDTLTRADGTTVTRHRHDNRLGLALLARLDRLAAQPVTSALGQPDEAAMRAAAHAFDALVDLVGQGELDADTVADFIEPHIRKLRELCAADRIRGWEEEAAVEDPAVEEGQGDRHAPSWGNASNADPRDHQSLSNDSPEEPYPSHSASPSRPLPSPSGEGRRSRRRRKGEVLVTGASGGDRGSRNLRKLRAEVPTHDDPALIQEIEPPRIWYREGYAQYQTDLPPPPDFTGYQHNRFGEPGYWRVLTPGELERQQQRERGGSAPKSTADETR